MSREDSLREEEGAKFCFVFKLLSLHTRLLGYFSLLFQVVEVDAEDSFIAVLLSKYV